MSDRWEGVESRQTGYEDGEDEPFDDEVELRRRTRAVERSGRRRQRARHGKRRKRAELTAEERAYQEAKRAAGRKMGFLAHLVPYLCTCLFLLFVAGFRPAMIVAMAWGIGLFSHYFFAIVAPGLRERLITQEVDRKVHHDVVRERRELADVHARRLEELSASIAHEIRNPITAAKSLVQQMGEDTASHENVEYANVALEELERVEKSVSHLLRFAREEDLHLDRVEIADVAGSALDSFTDRIQQLGVHVTRDISDTGAMTGDNDKLRRVLLNLIGNALDAFDEAPPSDRELSVQTGENLAGTEVWVRVRDNGPGIDPAQLAKIFSPFYTSKASGTGLGLAISKKLVDAHGGSIEAHSEPGSGTEFLITLPKEPTAEQEPA